jgi:tripartite-type tricarboxylate transporter receptor subunit TctC
VTGTSSTSVTVSPSHNGGYQHTSTRAKYRRSQPCNVPPFIETGSIRIIAAINDGRSKYFPDVPTMAQQGFAEAQVTPWFGIVIPAGTAPPIVDRISKALEVALATADMQQKLDIAGCEPKGRHRRSSPTSSRPITLWTKVVKDAGIAAD